MPLYGKWVCLWSYMGTPQRHEFLCWLKCPLPYYFDIEEIEWGLFFSESFSLSKNNKLSCFQYKLIHRVLALNPYLFKCKIKETELCSFCNEAKEAYKYLFWDCNVTKNFWFSIMDFLKNIDGSNVNLTPKGIILGNVQFESNLPVPNCILIFKYYL